MVHREIERQTVTETETATHLLSLGSLNSGLSHRSSRSDHAGLSTASVDSRESRRSTRSLRSLGSGVSRRSGSSRWADDTGLGLETIAGSDATVLSSISIVSSATILTVLSIISRRSGRAGRSLLAGAALRSRLGIDDWAVSVARGRSRGISRLCSRGSVFGSTSSSAVGNPVTELPATLLTLLDGSADRHGDHQIAGAGLAEVSLGDDGGLKVLDVAVEHGQSQDRNNDGRGGNNHREEGDAAHLPGKG